MPYFFVEISSAVQVPEQENNCKYMDPSSKAPQDDAPHLQNAVFIVENFLCCDDVKSKNSMALSSRTPQDGILLWQSAVFIVENGTLNWDEGMSGHIKSRHARNMSGCQG